MTWHPPFPVMGSDDAGFYVGHGEECVLLCDLGDMPRWKNAVFLAPDVARALGERLIQQAEASERAS